jgi:HSP20 family protein
MLVRFERTPRISPSYGNIFEFEREVDDMFRHFLGDRRVSAYPAMDVRETGEELTITAALPGVRKEDVKVSIHQGVLTVSGERKESSLPEGAAWLRNEITSGSFSRSIELPSRVEPGKVRAELQNGILRVVLPKAEEERPRQISVR